VIGTRPKEGNVQIQRLTGLVFASILAGVAGEATAQSTDVAYATPRTDYVVFLDSGARLSPVANDMVRKAAEAAKSARTVNVVGRRDYAEVVRSQLVRGGVPAQAIVVTPDAGYSLPPVSDGMADPAKRRVEISF
jgi:hypothetical protein